MHVAASCGASHAKNQASTKFKVLSDTIDGKYVGLRQQSASIDGLKNLALVDFEMDNGG